MNPNYKNTRTCPVCHCIYEIFSHTIEDQTYCSTCRGMLEKSIHNPTEEQKRKQEKKREEFFN